MCRFFLWINLVVAVYALMMTVLSFLMLQKGSTGESHPKVMWIFFVLNVVSCPISCDDLTLELLVTLQSRRRGKPFR